MSLTESRPNVLIAMTGSVAVLGMPQHLLALQQLQWRFNVAMSAAAEQFLRPYAVEVLLGQRVFTCHFETRDGVRVPHKELTRGIDALLVMPATANILAKAAHGICDDLISTCIVACTAPVVFVPSMNETMWLSKVVQRNVGTLRALGHHVIEPGMGYAVADRRVALGAIPPLKELMAQLRALSILRPA
ncbi:flavoprotein [Deinococcus multiflagellatus]|uniref:Flavoprotein n=1 Tax=Deinococcus multiflagellatus TaxID=1656887 RepID=A0ABW1ZKE6_9DEIO|nr:flavoprotein [Deinococcus multiflagellatus]MBZ9713650.1 hypothetical protein [Deinococcus multiflagellatus]